MREGLKAYAFMAPALVILILFTIIPIIGSLVLMFFDYSVLGQTKFVGFGNFIQAFHDRECTGYTDIIHFTGTSGQSEVTGN